MHWQAVASADSRRALLRAGVLLGIWGFVRGPAALATELVAKDRLDVPAILSDRAKRGLLNGIAVAGQRLVAVGQRGHIVVSEDGGKSWKQVATPVSSDLTAVHFASALKGWAVGHDGVVLATSDGGLSWTRQLDGRMLVRIIQEHYLDRPSANLPSGDVLSKLQSDAKRFIAEGPDKPFLDVWFDSESVGYVVGAFNLIFRTSDGGRSWVPLMDQTDNASQLHFYAARRVGGDLYLAGEQGMVLKLNGQTQRFERVSVDYKGTFFGIAGAGPSLLVFGLRGNIFRSEDAGASWSRTASGVQSSLTSAVFTADGRLVLASQAGDLLISSDQGKTFTKGPPGGGPVGAMVSPTSRTLVMVGPRGVLQRSLP